MTDLWSALADDRPIIVNNSILLELVGHFLSIQYLVWYNFNMK